MAETVVRYKLAAIKMVTPSKEHLEEHYKDLSQKPFFKNLVTYMLSGPIVAMVWEGRDAVKTGRGMFLFLSSSRSLL
ncbi:MAG: hypothetical protein Q9167_002724 [Letrouitia subvulpina]